MGRGENIMDQIKKSDYKATIKALESQVSVFVISSSTCGPCRALAPILDEISEETPTIAFRKVLLDEDEDETLQVELGIRGVPSLIVYRDGKEVARKVGAVPKNQIKNWLDGIVKG